MNSSRPSPRIWGIASAALIAVPVLCAAVATVMLEALLVGHEPASVNTMLPGWTYASATVMKVGLVAGVVAAVIAVANLARRRSFPVPEPATTNAAIASSKVFPIRGILSLAMPPMAPLVGAVGVVIAQAVVDTPDGPSPSSLTAISRAGVLVMLAWIAAGMALGVLALLMRERPRSLSILGVVTSACLIGLFWYCQFYKLGFDQDRWAGP